MIRYAVVAAALAAVLGTAAPVAAAELTVPVSAFDRIALGGSPEVVVTTGRAASVHATGDSRALDRLDIRVEGGTLKIGRKRGNDWDWKWGDEPKVRIAVTVPMIRGVDLGGSGTISIDRVKTPAFAAAVGGSGGVVVATLDTGRASFSLAGSGSLAAAGRCDSASVEVAGSGKLRLGGLHCTTLDVSIAGSGDVDAFASRTASVSVMGSGDVRVAGGARCAVTKHGSGSVDCGA